MSIKSLLDTFLKQREEERKAACHNIGILAAQEEQMLYDQAEQQKQQALLDLVAPDIQAALEKHGFNEFDIASQQQPDGILNLSILALRDKNCLH